MKIYFLLFLLCAGILLLVPSTCSAKWVQPKGPYGGNINAIAISGSIIFAGTGSYYSESKIYSTANNGETWTESSTGIPDGFYITALEASGSIIYAGLGSYDSGGSVYYSTNNGLNWIKAIKYPGKGDVISIKVIGTKITISSSDGVFSSIDNGENWKKLELIYDEYGGRYLLATFGNDLVAFDHEKTFNITGTRPSRTNLNLPANCFQHSLASTEQGLLDGTEKGIFRYSTLAKKWFKVDKGLTNMDVRSLVIKDSQVYAGTGTGIFCSSLDCENWKKVGLSNPGISTLAISGTSVFAGSGDFGVCRSTDNGATWSEVNSGISAEAIQNIADLTVSNSKLFANTGWLEGGARSSYFSINNGASWTEVPDVNKIISADTIVRLGKNLFSLKNGNVVLSINNGQSWKAVGTGLPKDYEIHSLAVSGNNLIAGSEVGVFISKNNGTNWTEFCTGLPRATVSITTFASSGNTLFARSTNGIFRTSNNGEDWEKVKIGYIDEFERNNDVNPDYITVMGLQLFVNDIRGEIILSNDNGSSWSMVKGASLMKDGNQFNPLAISGSDLLAIGTYGGPFRLINNGQSWSKIENDLPENAQFSSFAVSGNKIFAFIQGDGVACISVNNGKNWTEVVNDLPKDAIVSYLTYLETNLFAATSKGLYRSSNNGKNWVAVNNGLPNHTNVNVIAISGTKLYAGTDEGVFCSSTNGSSWTFVSTGLPKNTSVLSVTTVGANLFAGTNKGAFRSNNNGGSWIEVNKGLSNYVSVNAISVSDTDIILGTEKGVWKRPLSEIMTVE